MQVSGRPGPWLVYIRVTEACNARCRMCRFANSHDPYFMPLDRLQALVDELRGSGTREIRFTGGEPLLHDALEDAVRIVSSAGLKASIITNGALLEERAEALLRAGLSGVICSLDAPDSHIHDGLRRLDGLWHKATAGLRLLSQQRERGRDQFTICVNTIVSNQSFTSLPRFVPILEELRVDYWRLIPIKDAPSLYLTLEQVRQYNEEIVPALERALSNSRLKIVTPSDYSIFGRSDKAMAEAVAGRYPASTTCVVPLMVAYIDAKKAELTACNCLPHRKGRPLYRGGIWDVPFLSIWASPEYTQERARFAQNAPQVCAGCEPANGKLNAAITCENIDLDSISWF
jgi:cytosylglucuronate decarboxylase